MDLTKLNICAKTDVGLVRTINEDNYITSGSISVDKWEDPKDIVALSNSEGAILIVADGMGGANAGEVASEMTLNVINEYLRIHLPNVTEDSLILSTLNQSILNAHHQIKNHSMNHVETEGMGTTCSICYILGDKVYISYVGDSRVYRYFKENRVTAHDYAVGNLEQITDDHSLVWAGVLKGELTPEQARLAPNSNIITQSIGDSLHLPNPENRIYTIEKDDIILVCSDGLNSMVSDEMIQETFKNKGDDLDNLASELILAANSAGGRDNTTVALCKVIEVVPIVPLAESDKNSEPGGATAASSPLTSKSITTNPIPNNWFKKFGMLIAAGIICLGLYFLLGRTNKSTSQLGETESDIDSLSTSEDIQNIRSIESNDVEPNNNLSVATDKNSQPEKPTKKNTKKSTSNKKKKSDGAKKSTSVKSEKRAKLVSKKASKTTPKKVETAIPTNSGTVEKSTSKVNPISNSKGEIGESTVISKKVINNTAEIDSAKIKVVEEEVKVEEPEIEGSEELIEESGNEELDEQPSILEVAKNENALIIEELLNDIEKTIQEKNCSVDDFSKKLRSLYREKTDLSHAYILNPKNHPLSKNPNSRKLLKDDLKKLNSRIETECSEN